MVAAPLRVALIGGYGGGNFGNDASLDAALLLLRAVSPNAHCECICVNPTAIQARFNIAGFKLAHRPRGALRWLDNLLLRLPSGLFNWLHALWLIGRFDTIVWAGTGVFDDYRTGPLGFPAQVFRWCVAARLRKKKLIFLSVGAGPIINPLSRFFLRTAALCATHRSYRDSDSRRYMQSIGVDESKSPVFPDIAFALSSETSSAARPKVTVGVGVMAYRGWRRSAAIEADYSNKLLAFIERLHARGFGLRYLVAEDSDIRALAAMQPKLAAPDSLAEDLAVTNLSELMMTIRACDIVVGSRFHVLIAGLSQGRPCIALGYGPKHGALLESAGIGQFSQAADGFDLRLLIDHVEQIAADLEQYSRAVALFLNKVRDELTDVEAYLHRCFSQSQCSGAQTLPAGTTLLVRKHEQ